jgi:Methyltransferase FkbM domain
MNRNEMSASDSLPGRTKKLLKSVLPKRAVRALVFMRGIRAKRVSYSQYGEDLIVSSYFDWKGIKSGVYVDIGAFHPTWLSNTHLLHASGWTGHVYDIDSTKVRAFTALRGGRVNAQCLAVTPEPVEGASVSVYKFNKPWSELDTLSLEEAEARRLTGESYRKETVAAVSINELLDKVGKVHFLNIDIEGLDTSLLMAMNLSPLSPDVIVFEDNKNWGGSSEVAGKLEAAGYRHLFTSGPSIGYCRPLEGGRIR